MKRMKAEGMLEVEGVSLTLERFDQEAALAYIAHIDDDFEHTFKRYNFHDFHVPRKEKLYLVEEDAYTGELRLLDDPPEDLENLFVCSVPLSGAQEHGGFRKVVRRVIQMRNAATFFAGWVLRLEGEDYEYLDFTVVDLSSPTFEGLVEFIWEALGSYGVKLPKEEVEAWLQELAEENPELLEPLEYSFPEPQFPPLEPVELGEPHLLLRSPWGRKELVAFLPQGLVRRLEEAEPGSAWWEEVAYARPFAPESLDDPLYLLEAMEGREEVWLERVEGLKVRRGKARVLKGQNSALLFFPELGDGVLFPRLEDEPMVPWKPQGAVEVLEGDAYVKMDKGALSLLKHLASKGVERFFHAENFAPSLEDYILVRGEEVDELPYALRESLSLRNPLGKVVGVYVEGKTGSVQLFYENPGTDRHPYLPPLGDTWVELELEEKEE